LFLFLALLTAALLTAPIYTLLHPFVDITFHKLLTHISSLCGLLFAFIYLKANHLLNRQVAGYTITQLSIRHELITGIVAGIGIMLLLELFLFGLGVHYLEPYLDISLTTISILLLKAILAGLVIGLIEETLFRGALLGGFIAKMGTIAAVIFSSTIYAAVHFMKFRALPADTDINWYTGLVMFPKGFYRFSDPAIIDMFLTLFALGVLLSLVRIKKGNIYQCIGIHAGIVFTIKLINHITDYAPDTKLHFLVSDHNHLLGYLAFIWLAIIIAAYYRLSYKTTPLNR
jgi:hypothetical protein